MDISKMRSIINAFILSQFSYCPLIWIWTVGTISENFHFVQNHYNFRRQSGKKFKVDHVETETYGKQSISYFGPKIWNSIPQEIKNVTTLAAFKTKIKHWKPICSCRICRIYIQRVGFI